ncbi:hypothetical protein BHE74_00049110 [Ensete ventricosum]|nr:hypothetical protein BHE74_00049110 [Ensete ventricosum]RZR96964.1 hypothetical protein BHM03_00026060 [Ensete ventricosum]
MYGAVRAQETHPHRMRMCRVPTRIESGRLHLAPPPESATFYTARQPQSEPPLRATRPDPTRPQIQSARRAGPPSTGWEGPQH